MKFQQAAVAMLALLFTSVAAGADQRRLEAALRKSITDTWDKWNQGSRRDEEARYATAEFIEAFERLRRRPVGEDLGAMSEIRLTEDTDPP